MKGNHNHTTHSLPIVSQFKTPQPKHKIKQKQMSFSPLNLRNQQLVIKQTKKTTRKPSKFRP